MTTETLSKGGEINCIKAKDTIRMQDEEKYTQHKGGGVLMKKRFIQSRLVSNHRLNTKIDSFNFESANRFHNTA